MKARQLLGLLVFGPLVSGLVAGAGRASAVTDARTFDSRLPLEVVVPGEWGRPRVLGTTPSPDGAGVPLPAGDAWWVRPRRGFFGAADWKSLAKAVDREGIPGLETAGCDFTPLDAVPFGDVTGLRRLDLRGASRPGLALSFFAKCTGLRELLVDEAPLDSRGTSLLPRYPRLRRLTMPATDEGLADLSTLLELESLALSPRSGAPAPLRGLPPLPLLRELVLDGNRIGDGDLAALGRLPALEVLGLRDCDRFTGRGLRGLADLPRLRILDLRVSDGWAVCGTCGLRVAKWPGAPSLRLGDGALRDLARIATLERVNLGGRPFSPQAVEGLRRALPRCTVLWMAP